MPDWSDIISTAEAAAVLRCHPDHVSRLCREGKIDCHRLRLRPDDERASIWLVSRSSLTAYLERDRRWTWRRFRASGEPDPWTGDGAPDSDGGRTPDDVAEPPVDTPGTDEDPVEPESPARDRRRTPDV